MCLRWRPQRLAYPRRSLAMPYHPPVAEMAALLRHAAGFGAALEEGIYGDLCDDDVNAVLGEAGRFAAQVLAPINAAGDRVGAQFKDGAVITPPGWREAYRAWAQAGWNAV